jgi:AraC-like DNA-binding protein
VLIFGIVWSALLVVVIIHHGFYLFSSTFCTNGLFLLLSVFIILIGYFGLKQRTIFAQTMPPALQETEEQTVKYAGSSLKQEEAEAFAEKIRLFMQSDKPFLNPDLTLGELSDALAIPAHHLSQVIYEVFGLNFFNFVNRYRVDEVKPKILNPKYDNYSVLGIALECGFNSKTAFNRIFKHMTGLTPTEYKKTHNSQRISL